MAVKSLPEVITKDVLLHTAMNRFLLWTKMFWNPNITAQQMYEDLTCSVFSGDPELDFVEVEAVPKYQYNNDCCYFTVDGIEVLVVDLHDMRGNHSFYDVCILVIDYKEDDGISIYHPIPNTWLYGSTTEEFNEGEPVHIQFIEAARNYIKEHKITPDMQKADFDEDED